MRRSRLILLATAAACAHAPPAEPAPASPAEAESRTPPAPPTPPLAGGGSQVPACVVLENGPHHFHPEPFDTTYVRKVRDREYPGSAAVPENAPWYVNNEAISVLGARRVKYGLPRVLGPGDVVPVAEFRGIHVFAEPGVAPDVIYIPVNPACEFQAYVVLAKM